MRRLLTALALLASAVPSPALAAPPSPPAKPAVAATRVPAPHLPDGREDALAYWLRQRAYPAGTFPARAHTEAASRFLAMKPAHHGRDKLAWQPVGPAPLDTRSPPFAPNPNWSPAAGRIAAIALHPTDPKILYIGPSGGGVWKSTDGGQTFTPLTDALPTSAVGAIAVDPTAPETVWLGTGASDPYSGYYGAGIFKSTDGGQTWSRPAGTTFAGLSVGRIVLDPQGGAMYAALSFGYGGNGDACTTLDATTPGQGLFRSTDGGATWSKILDGTIIDVELDSSATPRRLHAFDFVKRAVHRSVDGGATWSTPTGLPAGSDRVELTIAPSQPSVIYAGVGYNGAASLYVSTDGGASYQQVTGAPNYCEGQCYFDDVVTVAPDDPGTVYLGGSVCAVWRGTGVLGGSPQFTLVSLPNHDCGVGDGNWPNGYVHPDVHSIVVDPHAPGTVYVGSDGGLSRSLDHGDTWRQLNDGMSTIELYAVCADPDDPHVFYGGAQDNGTFFRHGAALTWKGITTGDGSGCAVDSGDPQRAMVAAQYNTVIASSDGFKSDIGYVFGTQPPCKQVDGCGDRSGFVSPLMAHPAQAGTFLAGTYRVYRSTERGNVGTWKPISPDLTAGPGGEPCLPDAYASMDDYLSALGASPASAQVIYAGAASGALHVTLDGGANWTAIGGKALPRRFITGIAVDAGDPTHVAVSYSGFDVNTPQTPGHVFRSTDAGKTWKTVDTGMDAPVNTLLAHPTLPGVVYAALDLGVMISTDGGATFAPLGGTGLPNAPVWSLAFRKGTNTLIAGTQGRSAWEISFTPTLAVAPAALTFTAATGAPAAAQQLTASNGDKLGSAVHATITPSAAWLHASPGTGQAGGEAPLSISVSVDELAVGTYDGTVRVDAGAAGVVEVPVHVTVTKGTTPAKSCGCGVETRGHGAEAGLAALLALAMRRRRRR